MSMALATAAPTAVTLSAAASGPSPSLSLAPHAQRRFVLSDSMRGMNDGKLSDAAIDGAVFRRLVESDFAAIERVYTAYLEYFNHIKFRKEWDKPRYVKDEIEPMLREAAEYVFRVRQHLDRGKVEGETTLRQLDGEAQKFLHSDTGPRLAKADQSAFVAHLVHATLSDARGYVEGLSERALNRMIARLQRHRFCPAEHLRHVFLEGLEVLDTAAVEPLNPEEPLHYVDDGSSEDKAWRAAIASAYDASESCATALARRKKSLDAAAEALEQQQRKEAREAKIAEMEAANKPTSATVPSKD